VAFTAASLLCALAGSAGVLVAGRAAQGLGGAGVSAVGLSLIVTLYAEPAERARAMGVFTFVASGGGLLGVLLGGALIQGVGWRSIFVINLPAGLAILALGPALLEPGRPRDARARLDVAGAVLVTVATMLALLGCVRAGTDGWGSPTTLGLLAAALVALDGFLVAEARSAAPLVPLGLLRSRELSGANVLAALLRAAMFSWFFFAALYLQRVLGFSALGTGLGFLPAMALIGVCSAVVTPRLVGRLGTRPPFVAGAGLLALGLLLFALAPAGGSYVVHVLPGMLLIGAGGGTLFMPLMLAATTSAGARDAGLASGLVSTSQQLGGALGLAVLATVAASRSDALAGFHVAFAVAAALALTAALGGAALLRGVSRP